jgi:hypothetical protein
VDGSKEYEDAAPNPENHIKDTGHVPPGHTRRLDTRFRARPIPTLVIKITKKTTIARPCSDVISRFRLIRHLLSPNWWVLDPLLASRLSVWPHFKLIKKRPEKKSRGMVKVSF